MVYIDDQPERYDLQALFATASSQRQAYALRYRREADQRLSLVAYKLLRHALKEEYGISEPPLFEFGAHGKPVIVGHEDIQFNLSHCREAVACVIGERPVGIDVESLDQYDDELVRATMNEAEQRQIACSPNPAQAFMRFWTMKESLLKFTGEGISTDLHHLLDAPGHHLPAYDFHTRSYPRFVCTVCAERGMEVRFEVYHALHDEHRRRLGN